MIRFILKHRLRNIDHDPRETFITKDIDVPDLEKILLSNGYSQYGSEDYVLVGVEIINEADQK